MLSVIIPTIVANLATTGCALLLVRRGPTRRLKTLTFTVGLMSLAQTASFLHAQGILTGGSPQVALAHQMLAAVLSVMAIYVLGSDVVERRRREQIFEPAVSLAAVPSAVARVQSEGWNEFDRRLEQHRATIRSTTDLLGMMSAVASDQPSQELAECQRCRELAREMASASLELHLHMEIQSTGGSNPRMEEASRRVMHVLRGKQQHEIEAGHKRPLLEARVPRVSLVRAGQENHTTAAPAGRQ